MVPWNFDLLWKTMSMGPVIFILRDLPTIEDNWGADISKLVHYSVLRLRVYFWYFYLTNIDVMDQKNSSYQNEFNFIYVFLLLLMF